MSALSQTEAVRRALEAAGGMATLADLYRTAPRIEGSQWNTKTPFASIQRIVQLSDLFFRVRPGLWALESQRAALQNQLSLSPRDRAPAKTEAFDHGYYQGLLLEWGRFEGCLTTVPAQDKNRRFLGKPLLEVADASEPPSFTFEDLLRRARTIDVGWYNERRFPRAFFEVEHSTDILNSLGKFVEFQDLRARFFIVADELRRAEWNDKMNRAAFAALKGRVEFLSYESLAKQHALAAEKSAFGPAQSP